MKAILVEREEVWMPVTINITFENRAELEIFRNLTGNNISSAGAVAETLFESRRIRICKVGLANMFEKMYDAIRGVK